MTLAIEVLQEKVNQLLEDNKESEQIILRLEKSLATHQKIIVANNKHIQDLQTIISGLEEQS